MTVSIPILIIVFDNENLSFENCGCEYSDALFRVMYQRDSRLQQVIVLIHTTQSSRQWVRFMAPAGA